MTGPAAAAAAAAAPQFQPLQMPERAVPAPGETGPGAAVEEGYKSKVPALEDNLVDQLSRDEQEMLKTKHKAAEEADKKVAGGGSGVLKSVGGVLSWRFE